MSENMRMRMRTNRFIILLSDADVFLTDFKNEANEMEKKKRILTAALLKL